MKLPLKIVIINVGLILLFNSLNVNSNFTSAEFGLISLFVGLASLVIGLFALIFADKRYARGFLQSAGLSLLLGMFTCSHFIK